jgi:hypothetical protein
MKPARLHCLGGAAMAAAIYYIILSIDRYHEE